MALSKCITSAEIEMEFSKCIFVKERKLVEQNTKF